MTEQFDFKSENSKKEELEKNLQSNNVNTQVNDNRNLVFMEKLLKLMVAKNGSDLFITAGYPPAIKINGSIVPVGEQLLSAGQTNELAKSIMNERQWIEFNKSSECNFAISPENVGRFRVNAFKQQNRTGLVLRVINTVIPNLNDLRVPEGLKNIIMSKRGLVIIVGATGSGKSTTLAAMIGHRNQNQSGHIITIEDPIEFVHNHNKSIITQREVGVDTESWETALKNTLRQAPDVILIGEVRDRETMEFAIAFAETGHLCLCTLHANNSNQALDRIINFFPEEKKQQLLLDLSLNLRAVVSQRLIPSAEYGRLPAVEIMLNTPFVSDNIAKGDVANLKEIMKKSREQGMQTFDQALFDLYESNLITFEDAIRNADSANDLRLNIKLHSARGLPAEGPVVNHLKMADH